MPAVDDLVQHATLIYCRPANHLDSFGHRDNSVCRLLVTQAISCTVLAPKVESGALTPCDFTARVMLQVLVILQVERPCFASYTRKIKRHFRPGTGPFRCGAKSFCRATSDTLTHVRRQTQPMRLTSVPLCAATHNLRRHPLCPADATVLVPTDNMWRSTLSSSPTR